MQGINDFADEIGMLDKTATEEANSSATGAPWRGGNNFLCSAPDILRTATANNAKYLDPSFMHPLPPSSPLDVSNCYSNTDAACYTAFKSTTGSARHTIGGEHA